MCGAGTRQSPIDLHRMRTPKSGNKGIDDSISFSDNFWEDKAEGELYNNGHTGNFLGISSATKCVIEACPW